MGIRRRALVRAGAGSCVLLVVLAGAVQAGPVTTPAPRARTGAAAAADRADTMAAVRRARTERVGRWIAETLPAGDVDWFRYRFRTASIVSVTLGGLPADYDLAVFDATGRQRAASTRKGRSVDEAFVQMPAGDVLVRVIRKRRTAAGGYMVRLRVMSPGFNLLSARKTTTRGEVIGEFYNATRRWHAVSGLDVEWLDRRGRVVKRLETFMEPSGWVRPWSRTPFTAGDQITAAEDGRSTSVRVTPRLVPQDVPPRVAPLSARVTATHTWPKAVGTPGGRSYEGRVSTTSRGRVGNVHVYVCDYDAYGTLVTLNLTDRGRSVPARGSVTWFSDPLGVGDWSKPSFQTVHAYEDLRG